MTTQPPLFPAPPRKPKPPTRFELESRRRGAPFEVEGKRWRGNRAERRRRERAEAKFTVDPHGVALLNEIIGKAVRRVS